MVLRWAAPDPRFGPQIELLGSNTRGLLDLLGIGKTLASQRIAAEKTPPALLQVQPTRSRRNEDMMDARMLF